MGSTSEVSVTMPPLAACSTTASCFSFADASCNPNKDLRADCDSGVPAMSVAPAALTRSTCGAKVRSGSCLTKGSGLTMGVVVRVGAPSPYPISCCPS